MPALQEQVQITQRTRAQVLRDKVVIRLATNEMGPAIAAVLKSNGIELEGADWSKVFPSWLIATVDDDVIGCCQLLFSKPVGYVEFLFVLKSAPFKLRALAIRKLMVQSIASLQAYGCQYVGAPVAQKNTKFSDVIEKISFTKQFPIDLYVRRLA